MTPESEDGSLEELFTISAAKIPYDQTVSVYVAFKKLDTSEPILATFSNTLKFIIKDVDPQTGEEDEEGYEDEYMVGLLVNNLDTRLLHTSRIDRIPLSYGIG